MQVFSVEEDYLAKELKERVDQALLCLSFEETEVVRKHIMEGRSSRELEAELGWRKGDVCKVKNRALRKLRHPSLSTLLRGFAEWDRRDWVWYEIGGVMKRYSPKALPKAEEA